MAAARVCSECGASLEGKAPTAKTCSSRCRAVRMRRRAATRGEEQAAVEQQVAEVVQREAPTEIERELKRQLEPVVREAIDESVIEAIHKLVALTPTAIDKIALDLESSDPVMRQRAAALVVKYTIGHPALVKPTDETPEKINIFVGLPRPDDVPQNEEVPQDAEQVEETRVCDLCGEEKSLEEFVGGSDRCRTCFESYRARVLEEFGA